MRIFIFVCHLFAADYFIITAAITTYENTLQLIEVALQFNLIYNKFITRHSVKPYYANN